ncbi:MULTISPECIES: hypothetical protein [Nocardia]|uniref:hypothetical protein n=1 Tax=Nocardia TaxID=1817 RepID=UPI002107D21E|nr:MULTISPECIES: hypothetical protein [Nocardia]
MASRTIGMGSSAGAMAVLLAAAAIAAAPASAESGAAAQFESAVVGGAVVTTLTSGGFAVAADGLTIEIRDDGGTRIDVLPLAFELEGQRHRITQHISDAGRTLTLTPDTAGISSIASPMEEQLALNELAGNLTRGTVVGTLVGTVVGALVGAVIGLGSCLIVGPACLATTPAAIAAFAGAGGLAGTLLAGAATLVDGVWKYLRTRQSEPGQSPFANQDGVLDPQGTGVPDANLRLPSGSANGLKTGSSSGSSR